MQCIFVFESEQEFVGLKMDNKFDTFIPKRNCNFRANYVRN